MIPFNIPYCTGKELHNIKLAIESKKYVVMDIIHVYVNNFLKISLDLKNVYWHRLAQMH